MPEELLRSVVAYFDPVRAILFGSHCRKATLEGRPHMIGSIIHAAVSEGVTVHA